MSTLTDRYVWGVLRAVPESQRADLAPEIRALIADAMEARAADAAPAASPESIERAALTELGDPDVLAARYTGRTTYLIGPRFFHVWKRLLVLLLPIVIPLAAFAGMAAKAVEGTATTGEIVASGVSVAIGATIQTLFWFTLVFAIIERAGIDVTGAEAAWTPDRLPALPRPGRLSAVELALSISGLVFAAVVIVWQQVATPLTIDGTSYPLFDPALWSSWLPYFLVVVGLEVVFTAALYRAGRWTWPYAAVNAVLAAAFAIPAVWLLQTDRLFDPGAVAALQAQDLGGALDTVTGIITVSIIVISGWDAVDGFVKAWRTSREAAAVAR